MGNEKDRITDGPFASKKGCRLPHKKKKPHCINNPHRRKIYEKGILDDESPAGRKACAGELKRNRGVAPERILVTQGMCH